MNDSQPKTLSPGAWLVEWTESERGWGQRLDGCWYYPDKETAGRETKNRVSAMRKEEAGRHKGAVPDEYSFPGEPEFVQVNPKLAREIKDAGYAYRDRRER